MVTGEPVDVGEASEPFHLAAGELAGGDFDLFDGVGEGEAALEVVDELAVAGGFGGGGGKLAVVFEEVADLVEPAGGNHGFGAGVDAAVEGIAVPEQAEPEGVVAEVGCGPFGLPG